jgi:hypothetical protein
MQTSNSAETEARKKIATEKLVREVAEKLIENASKLSTHDLEKLQQALKLPLGSVSDKRLEQDKDLIRVLAKAYFDANEWQYLSDLLGKEKDEILFDEAEARKLKGSGEGPIVDSLMGIHSYKNNEMVKNGHPILQFYDFVSTIDNLNHEIRQFEVLIQRIDTLGDAKLLDDLKQKTLTPDLRVYEFKEAEDDNPTLATADWKLWKSGQELGESTIYDPKLLLANMNFDISIDAKKPKPDDVRPKTPYELCIDEVLLLRTPLLRTLIGLSQGLFIVNHCVGPIFTSAQLIPADDPNQFGKMLGGVNIPIGSWANAFEQGDEIRLPVTDNGTADISKRWHVLFQPKYTNLENYPNPWISHFLRGYANRDASKIPYPIGRKFAFTPGAPQNGPNGVSQTDQNETLHPHAHDGKGGPIGLVNWCINSAHVHADNQATKDRIQGGSFVSFLSAGNNTALTKLPPNQGPHHLAIVFYPFNTTLLEGKGTVLKDVLNEQHKHEARYTTIFSQTFEPILKSRTPKPQAQKIRPPPLALCPPNHLQSAVQQGPFTTEGPHWGFFEASRVDFRKIDETIGSMKQHFIWACSRLRKAFHASNANLLLKNRIIRLFDDVYAMLRKTSLSNDSGNALQLRTTSSKKLYKFDTTPCAPGQMWQFRDYQGNIVPAKQATFIGSDGQHYLEAHISPELTKCVDLVKMPNFQTGVGTQRAFGFQEPDKDKPAQSQYEIAFNSVLKDPVTDKNLTQNKQEPEKKQEKKVDAPVYPRFVVESINRARTIPNPRHQSATDLNRRSVFSGANKTPMLDDQGRRIYSDHSSHFIFHQDERTGKVKRVPLSEDDVERYSSEYQATVMTD